MSLKVPEKDANILPTWKENLLIKNSRHDPIPFGSLCHLYFCLLWATQKNPGLVFPLRLQPLLLYYVRKWEFSPNGVTWKPSEVERMKPRDSAHTNPYLSEQEIYFTFLSCDENSNLSLVSRTANKLQKCHPRRRGFAKDPLPYTTHNKKKSHSL